MAYASNALKVSGAKEHLRGMHTLVTTIMVFLK